MTLESPICCLILASFTVSPEAFPPTLFSPTLPLLPWLCHHLLTSTMTLLRDTAKHSIPRLPHSPNSSPMCWASIKHNQPVVSQMLQTQHDSPKVITLTNKKVSAPLRMPPIPLVTHDGELNPFLIIVQGYSGSGCVCITFLIALVPSSPTYIPTIMFWLHWGFPFSICPLYWQQRQSLKM